MTRSYWSKLSSVGSAESKTLAPEATTEHVKSDCCHRLLSSCSDIGLAAKSKSGRSGADFLGSLLPAVAVICSDFDPMANVEPSTLKLFHNLWFYIAPSGLAPLIQKNQAPTKSVSNTLNSVGSMAAWVLLPFKQWVDRICGMNFGPLRSSVLLKGLPPSSSQCFLGSFFRCKATYLLAVAFLEIIHFSSNGGILNGNTSLTTSRSAFSCVFEYLKTPNLMPAVFQCLTAIVHRAFETAVLWLVLWNSPCLDSLLISVQNDTPTVINDPAWEASARSLYQKIVREWIVVSLSYAPCTTQGLLQEKLCNVNTWQQARHKTDAVS